MKKSFKLLGLALVMAFSMSCEKDSDDKSNSFSFDSKSYGISNLLLVTEKSDLNVKLFSSTITYNSDKNEFTGTGEFISFEIEDEKDIELRTYTYSNIKSQEISNVWFYTNTKMGGTVEVESKKAETATFKVIGKNGGEYEIEFRITFVDGKVSEGYFKGVARKDAL